MTKLGWVLTMLGFAAIVSGLLYPIGVIGQQTFLVLLIGGAFVMFTGSMIRTFSMLKKK